MPRAEVIRAEVSRLVRAVPFRKFYVSLENGDRAVVEHPENIAFDPSPQSPNTDFYVITGNLRLFSSFEAVSNIAMADREGAAA